MNSQQVKIGLAVLGFIAAGVLLWWQMQPDEQHKQWMENFEKSQAQVAAAEASGKAPGTPAAARPAISQPAATVTRTVAAPAQSQFAVDEVDIDALTDSIVEIEFNYAEERVARNPMTPLVGPMAPLRVSTELNEGAQTEAQKQAMAAAQLAARSMTLSGIVWDKRNPVAVINNEVVANGHIFPSGIVVESIETDHVIIRVNESLVSLELKEL